MFSFPHTTPESGGAGGKRPRGRDDLGLKGKAVPSLQESWEKDVEGQHLEGLDQFCHKWLQSGTPLSCSLSSLAITQWVGQSIKGIHGILA